MSRLRLAVHVIGGALVFCLSTIGAMVGVAVIGAALGALP